MSRPPRPAARATFLTMLAVAILPFLSTACGRKNPVSLPERPGSEVGAAASAPQPVPVERETATTDQAGVDDAGSALMTVYFDYDRSGLGEAARATLRSNAEVLKNRPTVEVVIEGHCDERGTIEYNLALGQRRAHAVREYLASLGIPSSRISVVSYGEELPAERGHDESAWAKNRRADFRTGD